MKRIKWFVGMLAVVAASFVCVSTSMAQNEGPISEALEVSGIKAQLGFIVENVNSDAVDAELLPDPQMLQKMQQINSEAYAPEKLYDGVVKFMNENYNGDHLKKATSFFKSPVGKKIVQREIETSRPEAYAEMEAFSEKLQNNPPPKARIELLKRLEKATNSSQHNLDYAMTTYASIMKAGEASLPPQQRGQMAQMNAQMRSLMEPEVKKMTMDSLAHTYKDISDDELTKYAEFWETDAGKWFNEVSTKGLLMQIERAAEHVGVEMTELLQTPGSLPGQPPTMPGQDWSTQPGWGQQQPNWGGSPQQQPGWGQPQQPGWGQPQPGYGQPQQPGWGQQQPGWGQQQPGSGQQQPGWGGSPQQQPWGQQQQGWGY